MPMVPTRREWYLTLRHGDRPLWPSIHKAKGFKYQKWVDDQIQPYRIIPRSSQAPSTNPIKLDRPAHLSYPVASTLGLVPHESDALERKLLLLDSKTGMTFELQCETYLRPPYRCDACLNTPLRRPCRTISWTEPNPITGKYPRLGPDGKEEETTLESCLDCIIDEKACTNVGVYVEGPMGEKRIPVAKRRSRTINEILGIPDNFIVLTSAMQKARSKALSANAPRLKRKAKDLEVEKAAKRDSTSIGSNSTPSTLRPTPLLIGQNTGHGFMQLSTRGKVIGAQSDAGLESEACPLLSQMTHTSGQIVIMTPGSNQIELNEVITTSTGCPDTDKQCQELSSSFFDSQRVSTDDNATEVDQSDCDMALRLDSILNQHKARGRRMKEAEDSANDVRAQLAMTQKSLADSQALSESLKSRLTQRDAALAQQKEILDKADATLRAKTVAEEELQRVRAELEAGLAKIEELEASRAGWLTAKIAAEERAAGEENLRKAAEAREQDAKRTIVELKVQLQLEQGVAPGLP